MTRRYMCTDSNTHISGSVIDYDLIVGVKARTECSEFLRHGDLQKYIFFIVVTHFPHYLQNQMRSREQLKGGRSMLELAI